MPLTLAELRDVSFSKPPVGEPGYHPDEVDELLDRVDGELARLMEENTELRSQVAQLDAQLRNVPVDPGHNPGSLPCPGPVMPPLRPPISELGASDADHDVQAAKMLAVAQKVADQVREQAHAKADRMLTQARTRCAQLVSEARATAQDMSTRPELGSRPWSRTLVPPSTPRDASPRTRWRRWSKRRSANTLISGMPCTGKRAFWKTRLIICGV